MAIECRNKITILSFILSIFVLLIHVTNFRVYGLDSGPLYQVEYFFELVAHYAVPMFFAISGYLFFRNYQPHFMIEKKKKRIKTILIPFLIWGMLYCFIFAILPYIPVIGTYINQKTSLLNYLVDVFVKGQGTHLWYIRNLIIYLLLSPIVYYFIRLKYSFPFFGALMLALHMFLREGTNSISMYSIYYFGGAWAALHFCDAVEKKYTNRVKVFALIALCVLWITNRIIIRISFYQFIYGILFLIGIPLIWICSDIFRSTNQPKEFIRSSFFIYVSHVLILEAVEKAMFILLPHNQTGALADYIFAPVITLFIIFLIEKKKKKNKLIWSILTGNRG